MHRQALLANIQSSLTFSIEFFRGSHTPITVAQFEGRMLGLAVLVQPVPRPYVAVGK